MKKGKAAARRNYANRWREARWRAEQHFVHHCLTHTFEALNFVGLYSSIASAILCVLMSPHIVPTVVSRYDVATWFIMPANVTSESFVV
jgi:hypothetical protein